MSVYASGTSVSVERSRGEIERLLTRYGAEKFAYFTDQDAGTASVAFAVKGRAVRMRLKLPAPSSFESTARGRRRSLEAGRRDWEQACRQKWRCLVLVIKAKLEAIESGIATFEDEWLAYVVLPGGKTIGERIIPDMDRIVAGAPLLLGMDEGDK